jgi:hypothetical protein
MIIWYQETPSLILKEGDEPHRESAPPDARKTWAMPSKF